MGKRLPNTPNSKIRASLRMLFLRSRERAAAIKRDKYTCQCCGVKQSKRKGHEVKVEVHHKENILNWDKLFEVIREYLLCDPKFLEVLCKECHDKKELPCSQNNPNTSANITDTENALGSSETQLKCASISTTGGVTVIKTVSVSENKP